MIWSGFVCVWMRAARTLEIYRSHRYEQWDRGIRLEMKKTAFVSVPGRLFRHSIGRGAQWRNYLVDCWPNATNAMEKPTEQNADHRIAHLIFSIRALRLSYFTTKGQCHCSFFRFNSSMAQPALYIIFQPSHQSHDHSTHHLYTNSYSSIPLAVTFSILRFDARFIAL